jgi:hypothetical protein
MDPMDSMGYPPGHYKAVYKHLKHSHGFRFRPVPAALVWILELHAAQHPDGDWNHTEGHKAQRAVIPN